VLSSSVDRRKHGENDMSLALRDISAGFITIAGSSSCSALNSGDRGGGVVNCLFDD
jgi:hypothetical protein